MEFKEALQKSLKNDKHTHTDSFLLHSHVSDLVGNDYESKKAAEQFYRLDAKYEISKTILKSAPIRYKKRKKHYYKVKPMPIPPDNAYVYFGEDTSTLHLSRECPCLKGTLQIYKTIYEYVKIPNSNHKVHICRRCGEFTPKQTKGRFYRFVRWMFERWHIDYLSTLH